MTASALAGGVGVAIGTSLLLGNDASGPEGVALVVVAYPAGMALGTLLASEALGLDAVPLEVVTDAALGVVVGAAAGVAVGGATGLIISGLSDGDDDGNLGAVLLGGGVALLTGGIVSARFASRRVRAAPAMLTAPTGERAPGLSLTVAL